MKNSTKLLSLLFISSLFFYSCSSNDDSAVEEEQENPTVNDGPALYFFQEYNLKGINFDDDGGAYYTTESNYELTEEIYNIAYDSNNNTFFGYTHYSTGYTVMSSFESYNPDTQEHLKVDLCECDYHSAIMNTNTNTKVLAMYGTSLSNIIFQEINDNGEIVFQSDEISLGHQVSEFIYVASLDAYVAKNDNYNNLYFSIIDATNYTLQTVSIAVDYPDDPLGNVFTYSNINYDAANDILYVMRDDGLYTVDLNAATATFIETDWITFYQSEFGTGYLNEVSSQKTIYYPPTNELIIAASGFYGSNYGNNKLFAIDLATNETREITTEYHQLSRVYGFAHKY